MAWLGDTLDRDCKGASFSVEKGEGSRYINVRKELELFVQDVIPEIG